MDYFTGFISMDFFKKNFFSSNSIGVLNMLAERRKVCAKKFFRKIIIIRIGLLGVTVSWMAHACPLHSFVFNSACMLCCVGSWIARICSDEIVNVYYLKVRWRFYKYGTIFTFQNLFWWYLMILWYSRPSWIIILIQ